MDKEHMEINLMDWCKGNLTGTPTLGKTKNIKKNNGVSGRFSHQSSESGEKDIYKTSIFLFSFLSLDF